MPRRTPAPNHELRNLQTLVEGAIDKNSTVAFPTPLMSTIAELGSCMESESKAARELPTPDLTQSSANGELVRRDGQLINRRHPGDHPRTSSHSPMRTRTPCYRAGRIST
jgi:hypothetical protein